HRRPTGGDARGPDRPGGRPGRALRAPRRPLRRGLPGRGEPFRAGGRLGPRPERMSLSHAEPRAGTAMQGVVREAVYLGDRTLYLVEAQGRMVRISQPNAGAERAKVGDAVWASYDPAAAMSLPS